MLGPVSAHSTNAAGEGRDVESCGFEGGNEIFENSVGDYGHFVKTISF